MNLPGNLGHRVQEFGFRGLRFRVEGCRGLGFSIGFKTLSQGALV